MLAPVPRPWLMLLLLIGFVSAAFAQTERRVALVIGNGAYREAGVLRNPPNDARRMAEVLRAAGIEVIVGIDLDRRAMETQIREFGNRLEGGRVGLFFYAGHGMQVNGENFLVPIDANLQRERDLTFETVPLSQVLRTMESAAPTNLVFLDACRDNPLARSLAGRMGTRSTVVGQGLAQVQSGVGTLVSFATAPGSVSLDGEGANSPFTTALAQHLTVPGLEVGLAMRRVRESVLTATRQHQVPWDHSSLTGEVVLVPAVAVAQAPPAAAEAHSPGASPSVPTFDRETVFWQSAMASGVRADFEAYLATYPNGAYAPLARSRITALAAPAVASPSNTVPLPDPAQRNAPIASATGKPAVEAGSVGRPPSGLAPASPPALPLQPPPGTGATISQGVARTDPSFRLVNRSGQPITQINVTPVTVSNWGADLLRNNVLPTGQMFTVQLAGNQCLNDIRVVYQDGHTEERRRQETCQLGEVVFAGRSGAALNGIAGAPTAIPGRSPSLSLTNQTNRTITALNISASSDRMWGQDRLGNTSVRPGGTFYVRLPAGDCVYDVRVVYADQAAEERRRVDLCVNPDFVLR